jgi:hypothetical protein
MKQVIQLDADGYFAGLTTADESPLEPGVFLIPAGAVDAPVPSIPNGQRARWNGNWVFEPITQPPPPPAPNEPTYAEKREAEYPDYRDYLDGIVKGDQAQIDAYIAACLEVKAKYPKQ